MTDDEYKAKMDSIVQSLAMVGMMTTDITDADLDTMRETLSLVDSVGFMFATTFTFDEQRKRVDDQKAALAAFRTVRGFLKDMEGSHDA